MSSLLQEYGGVGIYVKAMHKLSYRSVMSSLLQEYGGVSIFMPSTLEKLKGHIALGLSVRPPVCLFKILLRYSFEISYMDSSSKIMTQIFFVSLNYLPLWSYVPFKGS